MRNLTPSVFFELRIKNSLQHVDNQCVINLNFTFLILIFYLKSSIQFPRNHIHTRHHQNRIR
jgi:hypothetical protein